MKVLTLPEQNNSLNVLTTAYAIKVLLHSGQTSWSTLLFSPRLDLDLCPEYTQNTPVIVVLKKECCLGGKKVDHWIQTNKNYSSLHQGK